MISGMTIAVQKMSETISFYQEVFNLSFSPVKKFGTVLYETKWGNLHIQFCPAEIAHNNAQQNRHQLNVDVTDLDYTLYLVKRYGGEVMGDIVRENGVDQAGIYDPDNNSLVLRKVI